MTGRVAVAALLPTVLDGCYPRCPERAVHTREYTETETISYAIAAVELASALDGEGELTLEGCVALCTGVAGSAFDWTACAYPSSWVPPPGDTGDTGDADSDVLLKCTHDQVFTVQDNVKCGGRAHAAVTSRLRPSQDWFTRAAHDEAASVTAFVALADELARHGALAGLVRRARENALDEVRHARAMAALARAHGSRPVAPRFRPVAERDLLAIGLENAVEGCVRETFGAFVAHHQARHAAPALRPVFAAIADDETRHAQWSWDLDAWLATVLSHQQREQVVEARRRALAGLGRVGRRPRGLGLPSARTVRRMARAFACALA